MGLRIVPENQKYEAWKRRLRIDPNRLDEEFIEQPVLYMEISEAYIEAMSLRDAAKEEKDRVDAEIAEEFRRKAVERGDKLSEVKVGDLVIRDPRHIKAFQRYAELHKNAQKLYALQSAVDQRGRMLRDYGNLYMSNHFDRLTVKAGEMEVKKARATLAKRLYIKATTEK